MLDPFRSTSVPATMSSCAASGGKRTVLKAMTIAATASLFSAIISGCASGPVTDNCKDVPKLQWKDQQTEKNVDQTLKLGADLSASAKGDLETAKGLTYQASASVTPEFSRIVKATFKANGGVSDAFWEQELTYRQTICMWDVQSRRTDITPGQKDRFLSQMNEFAQLRLDYTFVKEKKTGEK